MTSPLFEGIADETKERILSFFTKCEFRLDDVVMEAGEPGNEMFIIVSGEAVVKVNNSVVHKFSPGAVIGEVCLVQKNSKRTATIIVASAKLETLVINQAQFDELRAAFPVLIQQVIWNIAMMLGDKLRFANEEISMRQGVIRALREDQRETTRELSQRTWLQRFAAALSFGRSA